MCFRNGKAVICIEGFLEVEKDDWNVFIGFGNMGVVGVYCKRRLSGVIVVEVRLE